jgi:hypothetical protein
MRKECGKKRVTRPGNRARNMAPRKRSREKSGSSNRNARQRIRNVSSRRERRKLLKVEQQEQEK